MHILLLLLLNSNPIKNWSNSVGLSGSWSHLVGLFPIYVNISLYFYISDLNLFLHKNTPKSKLYHHFGMLQLKGHTTLPRISGSLSL